MHFGGERAAKGSAAARGDGSEVEKTRKRIPESIQENIMSMNPLVHVVQSQRSDSAVDSTQLRSQCVGEKAPFHALAPRQHGLDTDQTRYVYKIILATCSLARIPRH
eukprot:672508-Rhodomonas_salina.3